MNIWRVLGPMSEYIWAPVANIQKKQFFIDLTWIYKFRVFLCVFLVNKLYDF